MSADFKQRMLLRKSTVEDPGSISNCPMEKFSKSTKGVFFCSPGREPQICFSFQASNFSKVGIVPLPTADQMLESLWQGRCFRSDRSTRSDLLVTHLSPRRRKICIQLQQSPPEPDNTSLSLSHCPSTLQWKNCCRLQSPVSAAPRRCGLLLQACRSESHETTVRPHYTETIGLRGICAVYKGLLP